MSEPAPTTSSPTVKGKIPRIKKIKAEHWDEDGIFTFKIKVRKPWLSGSKKCYILAFENGETDLTIDVGGKTRNLRVSFILYAKVPFEERQANLKEEALEAEKRGDPQLY